MWSAVLCLFILTPRLFENFKIPHLMVKLLFFIKAVKNHWHNSQNCSCDYFWSVTLLVKNKLFISINKTAYHFWLTKNRIGSGGTINLTFTLSFFKDFMYLSLSLKQHVWILEVDLLYLSCNLHWSYSISSPNNSAAILTQLSTFMTYIFCNCASNYEVQRVY